ncbi:MAG: diguanylate cyclase, partial [Hyphomicrobiales bacterium]
MRADPVRQSEDRPHPTLDGAGEESPHARHEATSEDVAVRPDRKDSSLRRSQRMLKRQTARFTAAIENMAHGFSMFDSRGRLVACNQEYLVIYRLPQALARPGTPFRAILEARVAANTHIGNDPDGYISKRVDLIGRVDAITETSQLNSGQVIAVTHKPMPDGGWVSMHKDITELHSAQQELKRLAYHDALTGVANRNLFQQTLEKAFEAGTPFAVLFVDLDGFKSINDTFGHSSGDRLLCKMARRLQAAATPELVARMGGDEFAVFVASGDPDRAAIVARAIQESFAEPFSINGQPVSLAASIGVALAPRDGNSMDRLLTSADLALYAAKNDRSGTTRFFEVALDHAVRDRQQLESDLRKALELGEFELHYQP